MLFWLFADISIVQTYVLSVVLCARRINMACAVFAVFLAVEVLLLMCECLWVKGFHREILVRDPVLHFDFCRICWRFQLCDLEFFVEFVLAVQ